MHERVTARRNLELDLRTALAEGQFELYYQPIINLERNEIVACEALLRWHQPERGTISPTEFIPVAEETGLIAKLGEWVIRTACAEAINWPVHVKVSVNVSPKQFLNSDFFKIVSDAVEITGLSASRLEIEITESLLMQDTGPILATLNWLHDLGVRIAMDDFGTGYSSLCYMRSFPFSRIKIDRSFIKDLSDENDFSGHRPRDCRPCLQSAHQHHGRRRRDPRAAANRQGLGLYRDAGLSVQPSETESRHRQIVRGLGEAACRAEDGAVDVLKRQRRECGCP